MFCEKTLIPYQIHLNTCRQHIICPGQKKVVTCLKQPIWQLPLVGWLTQVLRYTCYTFQVTILDILYITIGDTYMFATLINLRFIINTLFSTNHQLNKINQYIKLVSMNIIERSDVQYVLCLLTWPYASSCFVIKNVYVHIYAHIRGWVFLNFNCYA